MRGSCEKVVVIPSTTNEWPENQVNEKGLIMASSSSAAATTRVMMEKPISQDQHQQQHQPPLKCPRCDSSNTKFCYYNNYSLSQPRHFCKACKRYWTRGGTLRNVPVGGGCRKNKRVKRPNPTSASAGAAAEVTTSSTAPSATANPTSLHQYSGGGHIDLSPSPSHHMNPLFYSLLTNPSDLNLPYPSFNSRVSNIDTSAGTGTGSFDLQMNGSIGLGFSSSGLLVSDLQGSDYRNGGFPPVVKQNQNQDVVSSNNSFLSASYPIFGSQPISTSTTTTATTMASLIASTLQQQKLINSLGANNFQQQLGSNYDDLDDQVPRNAHALMVKDVKMEDIGQNRLDWNAATTQNHIEQINSADASLLWNATTGVGAWLDPSNMGSSVPSLI